MPLPRDTSVLAAELRQQLFRSPPHRRLIGAEVEVLPLDRATGQPVPLTAAERPSSLGVVREAGTRAGWKEHCSAKGTPCFALPDGGTITFEPGGQIEYSSPPCDSVTVLLSHLRATNAALIEAGDRLDVELAALGIHPDTRAHDVPMQLRAPRYERMAEYFETIGPHGARMMRQTASFQVSVDLDADADLRWRVLNAAAPHLTAIFANSARYAGADSSCRSVRADCWRKLDPARTGIFDSGDPACTYLGFALAAPMMMLGSPDEGYPTFRDALRSGRLTSEDFEIHLSTLFPDVRPRGYLEVRAMDAIPEGWYAAPLALVAGITYDHDALLDAIDLLGEADDALLIRAGREGLRDPALATAAISLFEIALRGCESLGERFFARPELERARDYFAAYTSRGRSPADDVPASTGRRSASVT
ncbi:MAG TPA: glutamate-cysteine ligase family protein [Gemmatimonadaceae bacterium]|nr:glutamate-cysteine ligase family protein [Gemmatimonadaceae bacterium]